MRRYFYVRLVIDDQFPKVISARHTQLFDYVQAGANFAAARDLLEAEQGCMKGVFGLGVSVLANALLTGYPLGVFRLYSFKVHGVLDYGVASASAALPASRGFSGTREACYFEIQGAVETATAGITDYTDTLR